MKKIYILVLSLLGLNASAQTYTLQILHASDLEGGVKAIERAKYFAAIVDTLEEEYTNSITLSAGDNYIPGPFFNAAGDQTVFRDGGVFNNVYNRHYGVTSYDGLREAPGRADISIMNIIGFDASALGNHEFDAGLDAIEQIIEEDFRTPNGPSADRWTGAQFPYLSSNLDFSASGDLSDLFSQNVLENVDFVSGPTESTAGNGSISKIAAATYISRGGEKIGIVGATTPLLWSISSPEEVTVEGPTTNDMSLLADEIQPWIDSLTNNHGINKIILVTHMQQIQLEEQLAALLSGVDVIIAGGSDAILANANDRLTPGDVAVKPYPVFKENLDGDTMAIVSTNGEYSYVGRLVIEFDANGKLIPTSIDTSVSGPYVADSMMVASTWGTTAAAFADPNGKAALVDSLSQAVQSVVISKDGNIVGKSDVYLNGERASVRTEETNFGNLSADANLVEAKKADSTVLVSIKNGGGIRAAIGEVKQISSGVYEFLPPQANPLSGKLDGELSQLDIENSLRFNNLLSILDLTATDLKAILEHGVAASAPGQTPGQFAQVGGIKFSFDSTKAAGSKVQSAVIVDLSGNPIDTLVKAGLVYGTATRTIRVVTLNFLAGGGDGYPFSGATNRVDLDTLSTLGAGASTFAPSGSEQDALAEYLLANYATNPYDEEDTHVSKDMRIQNLAARADAIFGVSVEFDEERLSVLEDAGSVVMQVNYDNKSSLDQEIQFNVLSMSTADANDYTITALADTARANTAGTFDLNLNVVDDAVSENDEIIIIEIFTDSNKYLVEEGANQFQVLFIRDNDNVGPTATKAVELELLTSYTGLVNAGSTEILDYDVTSQLMFVTNSTNDRVEILDFSDPSNVTRKDSIDISNFGAINSLSVHDGVIACAIQANTTMGNGTIAFYDTLGNSLANVTVGVLPDMVTFSPDGNTVVVANEGEPSSDYTMDPEGSISIIDVSGGYTTLSNSNVTTLNFNAYDSQEATLKAAGIRFFGPNASVSQDMEPEYVAISKDNNTAFVTCQENNALVIVDLTTNAISSIAPLGWKDHSLAGNGFDTDRDANNIHIAQAPFRGYYMPDAIATYEVSSVNYVISANEGDSRDYSAYSEEARLDDLTLDETAFPNPEALLEAYGDVKVTLANGDTDNDGDYDEIYTYGARSFSIWNGSTGALVYDSGDDFEQIVKNHPEYFKFFNIADDDNQLKDRSDDKGPEPEAVVIGEVDGVQYAFIGMERTGGVMVYDISNPSTPVFVDVNIPRDTADGGGDQAPEGLVFIPKANSPLNRSMLVAANEYSSTISIWQLNDTTSTTSINELSANSNDLMVYPNPSNNQFFVTSENNEVESIELYDLNGRMIRNIQNPKQVQVIEVQSLEPSIYLLKVKTEKGWITSKVMVK